MTNTVDNCIIIYTILNSLKIYMISIHVYLHKYVNYKLCCCCSVTKSCPTLCDLQHTRLPCPSPSPGICSNSCPLSWWCYLSISSSAALFSFCLQSFPASSYFPMSQLFTSDGQSIGASALVSSPSNEYSGLISFRIDWFKSHRSKKMIRKMYIEIY